MNTNATAVQLDALPVQPVTLAVAQAIYGEGVFCGDCEYEGWESCAACRRSCLAAASAAIAAMPVQRPTAQPTVEAVARTIINYSGSLGVHYADVAQRCAEAVLALLPGRPESVIKAEALAEFRASMPDATAWFAEYTAGVKAGALRDAADAGELDFAVTHTSARWRGYRMVEAQWLRARADRIEAGE